MSDPAIVPQAEQFGDPFWDDPWDDGQWPGSQRVVISQPAVPQMWDSAPWDDVADFSLLHPVPPAPTPTPTPTTVTVTDKTIYLNMDAGDSNAYKGGPAQEMGDFSSYSTAANAVKMDAVLPIDGTDNTTDRIDTDAQNAIQAIDDQTSSTEKAINSNPIPVI